MADLLSQPIGELVGPDYVIWELGRLYKVIRFNSTAPRLGLVSRDKFQHYDNKLEASLSRARRTLLELALCNDWKYFCTFTISKENYDRTDLAAWYKDFSQWLRDQRKKYKKKGLDLTIDYVFVPELHDDKKSWHMHGLISDISPLLVLFRNLAAAGEKIPKKLLKGDYYNWVDYQKKFGFCSFGLIRNKVAVSYYITKYITKQLQDSCLEVGSKLYYPSQGLNRAVRHGEIYGRCDYLDKFLDKHYDFCSVGMTKVKDGLDWSFGLEHMDYDMLEAFCSSEPEEFLEVDNYWKAVQQVLDGF